MKIFSPRSLGAFVAVLGLLAGGSASALDTRPLSPVRAGQVRADTANFDPGNIISDDEFYNSAAFSKRQVQGFLNLVGGACYEGSTATPCITDYVETTPSIPADKYCPLPYQGGEKQDVATMVTGAANACGINPKVLLTLIQKEQGLLTASGERLTPTRYERATGFRCPDGQGCDPTKSGFFSQVYGAAHRLQEYRLDPHRFNFRAGRTYQIRYNPDATCGAGPVKITNDATAALYNYTPYQPNQAALDAYRATGDACSTYGNRNFWINYTEWFGPGGLAPTAVPAPKPEAPVKPHPTRPATPKPAEIKPSTPSVALGWGLKLLAPGGSKVSTSVRYGNPGERIYMGDWNGDGVDTPALQRGNRFYVRNTLTSGVADTVFMYGNPGDIPVVGDWNGDGRDTFGIFRAGKFYLRNSLSSGRADVEFYYGNPTDTPLAGDWNGSGRDTPGVWRAGVFYLRNTNTTGVADTTFRYGNWNDTPLTGDWDGNGTDTPAVRRAGSVYLRNANTTGVGHAHLRVPPAPTTVGAWRAGAPDSLAYNQR